MSILIKGMEMPTGDAIIVAIRPDGMVEDVAGCFVGKATPVPPHGRLIDGDAYEALLCRLGNREYRRENGTICDAIKFLHPYYAPTIIPADETTKKDGGQDDV